MDRMGYIQNMLIQMKSTTSVERAVNQIFTQLPDTVGQCISSIGGDGRGTVRNTCAINGVIELLAISHVLPRGTHERGIILPWRLDFA
jgi:hypothetical protein